MFTKSNGRKHNQLKIQMNIYIYAIYFPYMRAIKIYHLPLSLNPSDKARTFIFTYYLRSVCMQRPATNKFPSVDWWWRRRRQKNTLSSVWCLVRISHSHQLYGNDSSTGNQLKLYARKQRVCDKQHKHVTLYRFAMGFRYQFILF